MTSDDLTASLLTDLLDEAGAAGDYDLWALAALHLGADADGLPEHLAAAYDEASRLSAEEREEELLACLTAGQG